VTRPLRVTAWTAVAGLALTGALSQTHAGQPVTGRALSPAVATPTVTGPITGGLRGRPQTSANGALELTNAGYVEEEYFISGTATAYEPTTTILPDFVVPAPKAGDRATYRTRILVRRPADSRRFNGTVLVEWLNVTTQGDGDPEWAVSHDRLLIPRGYAWVGVSAQRAGVEGHSPIAQKNWDPVRYALLKHPGDLFAYDMFSQVGKALLVGARKPLGGQRAQVVIGTGASQSGSLLNGYLSGYYKTSFGIYDGFAPSAAIVKATKIPVPTIWNNSMGEALGDASRADSPLLRVWEVAGASHADDHAVKEGVLGRYVYDATGSPVARDAVLSTTTVDYQAHSGGAECPVGRTNLFPYRYVYPVKFAMLDRWIRTGRPAPAFPRLKRAAEGTLALDRHGNAIGGLRLPVIDVPVATYKACGSLDGTSIRLPEASLRQLYPTHAAYVTKLRTAVDRAVRAGLLFRGDAEELLAVAESSPIPDVE
jgi:hypothetical protein